MKIDDKFNRLGKWFRGQYVEMQELVGTVQDTKKNQEIADNIQKLCVQIQEEVTKFYN